MFPYVPTREKFRALSHHTFVAVCTQISELCRSIVWFMWRSTRCLSFMQVLTLSLQEWRDCLALENEGITFLRNVWKYSAGDTASLPRRSGLHQHLESRHWSLHKEDGTRWDLLAFSILNLCLLDIARGEEEKKTKLYGIMVRRVA